MEKLPEFINNHPLLFVAAGIVIGLIIINERRLRTRGFASLLPTEVVQKINQGAQVLDIRAEKDYKAGHIINALHMPADKVPEVVKKIRDKDQPIVVYCQTGVSCVRVASVLVQDGYSQVSMLRGGMQAWISDKLPISKG